MGVPCQKKEITMDNDWTKLLPIAFKAGQSGFHSYWLKMKMMEWSVNASLQRHSNEVGGPALRVPSSRRLPWTSFLFSWGAAVVDWSSRKLVATCQNSGYEITALQRPCKVWEHCAELRPCSFFGVPSAFLSRRLNGINVDIFRLRFRGKRNDGPRFLA